MKNSEKDTLYLGLTLAGAVSAGAYTAGVMDFLIEALEEWEQHREQGIGPTHKVKIPVIGGASAGGMTGMIVSSMINTPHRPISGIEGNTLRDRPENKLYHSWVDMMEPDMFPRMLDPGDIDGEIHALLNSEFIEEIADRALKVDRDQRIERPYFDEHLRVFTTLTNLKGLTYHSQLNAGAEDKPYYFTRHSDYAAFALNKSDYENNGWIPLNYFEKTNVDLAKRAAMSTGAFPLGLKARKLRRDSSFINDLKWNEEITRHWGLPPGSDYTLCVDGGVINNEPFFKVQDAMETYIHQRAAGDHSPSLVAVEEETERAMSRTQNIDDFDCTNLMIDPFPSVHDADFDPGQNGVISVAKNTLSAMLSQSRLKPDSLEEIYDPDNPDQYLIAPVRYQKQEGKEVNISGSEALACGFLGGFGGFLHKEFRIHDFFLGRANCERFLREYFTVPKDCKNPIFKHGYEGVNDRSRFQAEDGSLQIIPVFREKKSEPFMPVFEQGEKWPVRRKEDIDRFLPALKRRIGTIVMNIGDLNWFSSVLLWIGNRVLLRRKLAKTVLDEIERQMQRWGLLD